MPRSRRGRRCAAMTDRLRTRAADTEAGPAGESGGQLPASASAPIVEGFEPLLVSLGEIAHLLGVSKATIERMKAGDRLGPAPVVLSRGCIRYRLDEIREWVR